VTSGHYDVSIRRLEPCARFEAVGSPETLAAALRLAAIQLPSAPATSTWSPGGVQVDWLGPRRYAVTAPMPDEQRLLGLLQEAFTAFEFALVFCCSDMVTRFELAGPGAPDVLAQGTALDMSDQSFALGSAVVTDLWGVAAVIEHPLDAPQCRRVIVDRSLAGFIEGWMQTANGLSSTFKPGVMRTAIGAESVAGRTGPA